MKPRYIEAVYDLVGDKCMGGLSHGPVSEIKFIEGTTPPTENEIQTRLVSMLSDYDAQAYARNRAAEYPSTGDQLDYIFHNGVAKWKTDMIEPVKAKYPKPS